MKGEKYKNVPYIFRPQQIIEGTIYLMKIMRRVKKLPKILNLYIYICT